MSHVLLILYYATPYHAIHILKYQQCLPLSSHRIICNFNFLPFDYHSVCGIVCDLIF